MPPSDSQTFLRELDKKLWTAADRLRSNLDAAVYKHAVPRTGGLRTASLPYVESAALFGRASSLPHSSSAFLGDLCVFAVQNSSDSANFAWVQHMLHHLAPNGSMALLLANGSMGSNSLGEGDIRRNLPPRNLKRAHSSPLIKLRAA